MQFSYKLLKRLCPKIPAKKDFIERFNLLAFEVEDARGDVLSISIPANRYADAASHIGVARIAAAIWGDRLNNKDFTKTVKAKIKRRPKIIITDDNGCDRYNGRYVEIKRVGTAPDFMREALLSSGARPINGVVDVMNYATLEIG